MKTDNGVGVKLACPRQPGSLELDFFFQLLNESHGDFKVQADAAATNSFGQHGEQLCIRDGLNADNGEIR